MSTLSTTFLTSARYLELERTADFKSEYYQGETFAMAGVSLNHNRLVLRLVGELDSQLRKERCEAFIGDMRVRVAATGLYAYPDVCVVCGQPEISENDNLLNPVILIEVLSPSTEAYDRGRKFEHYKTIPSLQQYMLVAQDRMSVHLFSRDGDAWRVEVHTQPDAVAHLTCAQAEIRLGDLYRTVVF